MRDQNHVMLDIAGRLDALGIPYMLSGSVALSFYAEPRMTRDIDIVVEISRDGATRLAGALVPDYYVDADAARRAAESRDMFNAIHLDLVVKVDFIVRKDGDYRRTEFARRRRIDWEGRSLTIVAPEDLLLSKLVWAGDRRSDLQMRDARSLLDGPLDLPYLRTWADRLGVSALLEEIER